MFSRGILKKKSYLFLIFIILFLSFSLCRQRFTPWDKFFVEITAPFQKSTISLYHKIIHFWQVYVDLRHVKKENLRLKQEIRALRSENDRGKESLATTHKLQKLLGLKSQLSYPCLGATVIGNTSNPWFKTIFIDKGSRDGIQMHAPIVMPEGLVGQVINVSPHYAKVLLIIDHNSRIAVICRRSKARGIFVGQGNKSGKLEYVPKDEDIKQDDILVTSGLDGIFPKGIVVGKVLNVRDKKEGLFKEVWVKTAVNFGHLEDVLALIKERACLPMK